MNVTPVSGIEQVAWGAASILRRVNDGVFICTCNVQSVEYNCRKSMNLFMTFISNLWIKLNVVGFSYIIELT